MILGRGFVGVDRVEFDGLSYSAAASSFTVNSSTQITAVAPPWPLGDSADITVHTLAGPSLATQEFTYNPIVTDMSPNSGPMNGGTNVTITGQGFNSYKETGGTTVYFGGVQSHVALLNALSAVQLKPLERLTLWWS
jgi:hypothetical protein